MRNVRRLDGWLVRLCGGPLSGKSDDDDDADGHISQAMRIYCKLQVTAGGLPRRIKPWCA